ncbi:hypothetical protein COB18_02180 [Candidatus Kaiserbacteria bacterium]|nr:MAG: hypothetical protein COB18_02180 [Candidatus Kaiserbacteria bacterium]
MSITKDELRRKIDVTATYLKEKVTEMENSQSTGISMGRQRAHTKIDELKRDFLNFETTLKNRE